MGLSTVPGSDREEERGRVCVREPKFEEGGFAANFYYCQIDESSVGC